MNYTILVSISICAILIIPIISEQNVFGVPAGWKTWVNGERLTWDDFKTDTPEWLYSAYTTWYVSPGYDWKFSETSACHYEFKNIWAIAYFVPYESWVLKGQESDSLLNHEQGHFDIAQIQVKEFKEQAKNELMNKKFPCPTNEKDSSTINKISKKQVSDIFDQNEKKAIAMQRDYDGYTNHGKTVQNQLEWDEKIHSSLNLVTEKFDPNKTVEPKSYEIESKDITIERLEFQTTENPICKVDFYCYTHYVERGKTSTRTLYAYLNENTYVKGSSAHFFVELPNSSITEYTIPIHADGRGIQWAQLPMEFSWESERGEYKIIVEYQDQILEKYLFNVIESPQILANIEDSKSSAIKSELCWYSTCDTVNSVLIERGQTVNYLLQVNYPKSIFNYYDAPVILEIKFPDSTVKKYTISETWVTYFEHPLKFDWESQRGDYEITVKGDNVVHGDKNFILNVVESNNCYGICHPIIVERGETEIFLLSGKVPSDLYAEKLPVKFTVEYPDSNIIEYNIPVTRQKYFEYPLEFNLKSEEGDYIISVFYRNQEIQKEILIVEN